MAEAGCTEILIGLESPSYGGLAGVEQRLGLDQRGAATSNAITESAAIGRRRRMPLDPTEPTWHRRGVGRSFRLGWASSGGMGVGPAWGDGCVAPQGLLGTDEVMTWR